MKKSWVYTATGDKGTTSLVGGKRVKKCDFRLDVYGTVDELNSLIGSVMAVANLDGEMKDFFIRIQNRLFNIGGYLATDNPENKETVVQGLSAENITAVERMIDWVDEQLPPLNNFVLPTGGVAATQTHVCRSVTRRCERLVVALADMTYVDPNIITYLNRLSDFFFVFARFNNLNEGIEELFWDKNC